jgi:cold-inducible RNA-binding protein
MKNIYVGNLDVGVTEEQVRELFQAHGAVETVSMVRDRDTGHSRGFAFVEMTNDIEAEAAITALKGSSLGGKQVSINEARPKQEGLDGKVLPDHRKHQRESLDVRSHRKHRY